MNPRIAAAGVITLSLLVAGCSGGSSSKTGGGAASAAPPARGPFAVQSYLTAGSTQTAAITFTLGQAADPSTVQDGVTVFAFEDADANPGGSFRSLGGAATLDAAGTTLSFTPGRPFRDGREVRVLLTTGIRSATNGAPLERGAASAGISFGQAVPDAVFEGRFRPAAGGAPTTSTPITPTTPTTPSAGAPAPAPPASSFRPQAGTDVWHIDFELRASDFADDMGRHGLRSGDPATDRAARALVIREILATASEKYGLRADGTSKAGSWKVSFTDRAPSGTPGRTHSREAVGGRSRDGNSILGSSLYDSGNRRREDNARAGRLGIFTRNIWGQRSRLDPALTSSDRAYVDGSYRLGRGTAAQDRRFQQVREVIADWGHAVGSVVAHEVGHSVGLLHDNSSALNLMSAATGSRTLSDRNARFGANSSGRLDRNLGKR